MIVADMTQHGIRRTFANQAASARFEAAHPVWAVNSTKRSAFRNGLLPVLRRLRLLCPLGPVGRDRVPRYFCFGRQVGVRGERGQATQIGGGIAVDGTNCVALRLPMVMVPSYRQERVDRRRRPPLPCRFWPGCWRGGRGPCRRCDRGHSAPMVVGIRHTKQAHQRWDVGTQALDRLFGANVRLHITVLQSGPWATARR